MTTPHDADTVSPPDVPDARGWSRLEFAEPLESEFRREHLLASRRWVRLSLLVSACTVGGFALIDHLILQVHNTVPDFIRFGIQLPSVLVMILATSSKYYERAYMRSIVVVAPLFGLGTVVVACNVAPEQTALIGARLLLVAFFFYFMLGLRFSVALRINVIVMSGYVLAALLGFLPSAVATYEMFALFCANLIGGAGCFALERATRAAFLERRQLADVAAHDGLTGLFNRNAFEQKVREIWRKEVNSHRPVTVLMIDIDHFKAYNDYFGHQAGDTCLRRVAIAIKGAVRADPGDLVARYGGEELIAILPGTDRARAEVVGQRILDEVAALALEHTGVRGRPFVSVSIGAATHEAPIGDSHERAVRIADRALYTAKRQGRNRCIAVYVPNPGLDDEAEIQPQEADIDSAAPATSP